MCGLVGLYTRHVGASEEHLKLLANMLYVDQLRGEHATGLAKIDLQSTQVQIIKKAVNATQFLADESVAEFLTKDRKRLYIGHNRWATMGRRDDDAGAHPFQADHITLAHNGTVNRWILKDLEGFGDAEVDSDMVARTIAKHGAEKAITTMLSGNFALTWYDANERSLNFIRNNARPLWLAKLTDQTILWASEREFIDFFIRRGKGRLSYAKDGAPTELPEDNLLTFYFTETGSLKNNKFVIRPMKFHVSTEPVNHRKNSYYGSDDYDTRSFFPDSFNSKGSSSSNSRSYSSNPTRAFSDRVNKTLEDFKLTVREGDTIVFTLDSWSAHGATNKQAERGTATGHGGTMNHMVKSYNCQRSSWVDSIGCNRKLRGRIVNAWKTNDKLEIVVDNPVPADSGTVLHLPERGNPEKKGNGAAVVDVAGAAGAAKNVKANQVVSGWRVGSFPLKVQGHTFSSREEFERFVQQGCALCNRFPTINNVYNPQMAVYFPVGGRSDDLRSAEYICGMCVNSQDEILPETTVEDDEQQQLVDKILRRIEDE